MQTGWSVGRSFTTKQKGKRLSKIVWECELNCLGAVSLFLLYRTL